MKRCLMAVIAFSVLTTTLQAQRDETLIGRTGLRFSGVWGGSNLGLAGFSDNAHGMAGGFFGLEFSKSLTAGLGRVNSTESTTYNGQLRNFDLRYGGLLLGFAYRPHKVLHPRVSFLIGSGNLKFEDEPDDQIFVVQPSAGLEVNVFRWMRLGLEGGYRFVSNTSLPKPNDGDASSAFVQLSLRFGWSWGREGFDELGE
ncbi:MAG: hypothetical protein MUC59_01315 [Saprospiraceae bacterium]|nr:hypothetical protein [Saprospiraceae bacterium]